MRPLRNLFVATICLCGVAVQPVWADDAAEVRRLTSQAEAILWFGLAESGRVDEFAEALELLDRADELLGAAAMPDADRTRQNRRIELLREDLTLNLERSRPRFFGTYPLARLIVPLPMMSQQRDLTETVLDDSANEAVRRAAQRVVDDIVRWEHPHVILRSVPPNRAFENEAMRVFADAPRPFAHSRAELVEVLTAEELAAYDRGDLDSHALDRLMEALGAAKLLVVTVRQDVDLADGTLVVLDGESFHTGSMEPTDSFAHRGFSRGREGQIRWIFVTHLVLLAVALVVAGRTPWSLTDPWPVIQRVAMGAGLFVIGRVFTSVAVMVVRPSIPEPDAAAASAWWWPALVGLLAILGSGFVGWVAQARTSRIVPGSRTSRAVGTTFVLAALGACAYFIEPLLLLDPGAGPFIFVPLVLACALLASLTGYAVRTGPPVPSYFVFGPVVVAPVVGMALLAMSIELLWATVVAGAALWAVAVARHRYAVNHGLEEAESDDEAAEQADRERLEKLGKGLDSKLPI